MISQKMNIIERRSTISLSMIIALRLMGLFMVLPLFALYASHLPGATPFLIGLAMGVYGLMQAILQIPFGIMSDHYGRKHMIAIGLIIFILGSVVAALSTEIWGLFIGRALQGAGAVGGTLIALMADLTREEQRTKAMAFAGMTIGLSFMLSLMLGPLFASWVQVNGIFWIGALFGIFSLVLLYAFVPDPTQSANHLKPSPQPEHFYSILTHPELARLNIGIFILHAIFTASFVVIPIGLQSFAMLQGNEQWILYLPILFVAFCIAVPCLLTAEKWRQVKPFFIAGIILLLLSEMLFWLSSYRLLLSSVSLLLFFSAFSLLEAFLPSLISRAAPASRKGTALGIYSFAQFFGIFIGGAVGGWLYGRFGLIQVNIFCAILAIIWLAIAFKMKKPQYAKTNHQHHQH